MGDGNHLRVAAVPGQTASAPAADFSAIAINAAAETCSGAPFAELARRDWSFTNANTRQYTHDIHPYPAKFIPQLAAQLIELLSAEGDTVFDPFGGSGTTAAEATRLGRNAVSMDANPLCSLLGRTKTARLTKLDRAQLASTLRSLTSHANALHRWPHLSERWRKTYEPQIPAIPNLSKWFASVVQAELALVRHIIASRTTGRARDVALVAFSRIITRMSYQDSETRYVAVKKQLSAGDVLRAYLESLRAVSSRLELAAANAVATRTEALFFEGDSRTDIATRIEPDSVDLIVTSPPYPNATDYHLYHRFRLFWLGHDPRDFGRREIGSHLKHQRNRSDMDEYLADMRRVITGCVSVLRPGKYAAFVLGDAVFKGTQHCTSSLLADLAAAEGLEVVGTLERPIHETKRSFAAPARRARVETLLVLRKPLGLRRIRIEPPRYKMWPFEATLRKREIECAIQSPLKDSQASPRITVDAERMAILTRLTFSSEIVDEGSGARVPTWQSLLEKGDKPESRRKDPKYVTHGLHPYKGKFYPQLAKALMNCAGLSPGDRVYDPYCGSGTVLLEAALNGYRGLGCDLNPLAAKVARAKTSILDVPFTEVSDAIEAVLKKTTRPIIKATSLDGFAPAARKELVSWFPVPVAHKLATLLEFCRAVPNAAIVEYLEIIVSSIVRDVSNQEPSDLRIRRRRTPLTDAPVFDLFRQRARDAQARLARFDAIRAHRPRPFYAPIAMYGGNSDALVLRELGVGRESIDCVITSPPYATALPYIDTDRLSFLLLFGETARQSGSREKLLTGSREVSGRERARLEQELEAADASELLPPSVVKVVRRICASNKQGVGFRRRNTASLLWRYFTQISTSLARTTEALKSGAPAFVVVGDSRTQLEGQLVSTQTCRGIAEIGERHGLRLEDTISIDVTREGYRHLKNAITENQILCFVKAP